MEPEYDVKHARQDVRIASPDLAGTHWRKLLIKAKEISRDSIQQLDHTQFHVASQTRQGSYYAIDLQREICECKDYPGRRFCKHIAAIYVHFPHLNPDLIESSNTPTPSGAPEQLWRPRQARPGPEETLQSLTEDISDLSQQLISFDPTAVSLAIVTAYRSAKHSLSAAIASAQCTSSLPHKE